MSKKKKISLWIGCLVAILILGWAMDYWLSKQEGSVSTCLPQVSSKNPLD